MRIMTVVGTLRPRGLTMAAWKGSATAVQAVLNAGGSDLEAKEEETGCTAFVLACENGDAESVRILAEAGCDTIVADS